VIGLHFFSPANVMRLLEIVRTAKTSAQTVATCVRMAKTIGKVGVVVGECFGFVGNRMMLDGYFRETELLLLEGAMPEQIDSVLTDFGFAMGPCAVNDMAGIDVAYHVRRELLTHEDRADPYLVVSDALARAGRNGQKTGRGIYRYEPGDRTPHSDTDALDIIDRLAAERHIQRRTIRNEEILERCIFPLINIGAQILQEGLAARPSDIDVIWANGYGFPRHRGGPMFYADTLGIKQVYEKVVGYHERLGHYWEPAPLLADLARQNKSFANLNDCSN
jgi:3-hydroxyacyl-CoA dehydrogenase